MGAPAMTTRGFPGHVSRGHDNAFDLKGIVCMPAEKSSVPDKKLTVVSARFGRTYLAEYAVSPESPPAVVGRSTVNVAPWPGLDFTSIFP